MKRTRACCPLMAALFAAADDENDGRTYDEIIADALTDVRLFAHVHQVDFYRAMDRSYMHYLAEKDGDDAAT